MGQARGGACDIYTRDTDTINWGKLRILEGSVLDIKSFFLFRKHVVSIHNKIIIDDYDYENFSIQMKKPKTS